MKSHVSPEQQLLATLSKDPAVDAAMAALQAATDRFDAIRGKLNDDTVERGAIKRDADARTALVRAQALFEIDGSTAADVAAAREAQQAAWEALQGIAGRDGVLVQELAKAQLVVVECRDTLEAAFAQWLDDGINAAKAAAAEGGRLVQLAALALRALDRSHGYFPRNGGEVGEWLLVNNVVLTAGPLAPSIAESSNRSLHLLRRAAQVQSEEIRTPRRPDLKEQPAQVIAPTFSAPGIPRSLTHDPLGNALPEARAVIARQAALRRAPYDDGREGVEEASA